MDDKNTEIRVAVALVALRFKPIRQSYIGYVLGLRDRFPCPGGDAQSVETTLVSKEWRERALELETRCTRLERMFEWDKLERLVKTNTAGHGGGKRDKAENRTRAGLERVVNGKMSGQGLDAGEITISARSALTIYERLMRAQEGLVTRTSDTAAERDEFSLTVIPVTFAVARSGLEELGNLADAILTKADGNSREICDVLSAINWMLRGMLQSMSGIVQRFKRTTGLRAKHAKQLERLVEEECDRTFGALTEKVLVRLVRLIFPWVERAVERLEAVVGVPMELLGILEGALDAAEQHGFNGGITSVRERVALEACQELRRLPRRIPADGGGKDPVEGRKQRLVKKEAVWYLGRVVQRTTGTTMSARIASRLMDSARVGRLSVVEREFVFSAGVVVTE